MCSVAQAGRRGINFFQGPFQRSFIVDDVSAAYLDTIAHLRSAAVASRHFSKRVVVVVWSKNEHLITSMKLFRFRSIERMNAI